jgi:hypothetical protein
MSRYFVKTDFFVIGNEKPVFTIRSKEYASKQTASNCYNFTKNKLSLFLKNPTENGIDIENHMFSPEFVKDKICCVSIDQTEN